MRVPINKYWTFNSSSLAEPNDSPGLPLAKIITDSATANGTFYASYSLNFTD